MKMLIEIVGEAAVVGAEEVVEPSSDPLQPLVFDVGCTSDGRRTADRVALTWNVYLEVYGRAGRVVAEPSKEHSGLGYVFGLAKGAEGTLLEMEHDTGRCAERHPGRHRHQIGDHGYEKLFEVAEGDGTVDAYPNSDKGFCCRKVTGLGEQQNAGMFAG